MRPTSLDRAPEPNPLERTILDAAKRCVERWGVAKVTIDDIAGEARVSRATLYRLFPGGKDVLFDALRVRELEEFFTGLRAEVEGTHTLEELLVRTVVHATRELRADDHLAVMLSSEPGETVTQLTVEGLPRVIRVATAFLVPLVDPYLPRPVGRSLIDVLARLVLSYFLAPSDVVDLGDEASAREFIRPFLRSFDPPLDLAAGLDPAAPLDLAAGLDPAAGPEPAAILHPASDHPASDHPASDPAPALIDPSTRS